MAEAVVEDRPIHRFYCHMCNIKFESSSPTYTCPQCSDGFVEQLESTGHIGDGGSDLSDSDDDFQVNQPFTRMARTATSNLRQQTQTFENLIQDFIVNLGVGVNVMGGNGNMQLFLGNPGDYAWGREGLDAIVTQLLNQMDTTGPPPLSKDLIDAIPMVEVSHEQVESKLQCSVCWEDFKLNEKVRQLACQHVYHEPCIRPWLELHGTCPICRQDLGNEEDSSNPRNDPQGGNTLNTLQQLFQAVQNSSGFSGSTTTTDSSDTTSSSGSSNTDGMNNGDAMN